MYGQQYRGSPGGGSNNAGLQSTYDSALSFLKQLNTSELQAFMDDNDRLNKMVDDLELVKAQESEKETLLASNMSTAEYNLSMEPRLIQTRQQLAETYGQAVKIQKEFEQTKLKLDTCSSGGGGGSSLDLTLALLQTEAAKAEDASDECAETYLSQSTDTEEFVHRFVQLRTQAHLRRIKAEKMAEIVREKERQRSMPTSSSNISQNPMRPAPIPPTYNNFGAAAGENNGWRGSGNNFAAPPYPSYPPAVAQYPPRMMMPTLGGYNN